MQQFIPLLGGALIGLVVILVLFAHGWIAGVSGFVAGATLPGHDARGLRLWFLGGLLLAGLVASLLAPRAFGGVMPSTLVAGIAGLLVGYGTRLGGGCTSGHGVCGISRFSLRSVVATLIFMGTAMVTVFVIRMVGK